MSEFKVGQKWKMRNGNIATIVKSNVVDDCVKCWAHFIEEHQLLRTSFYSNGTYWLNGEEDDRDLMELIK